MPLDKKFINKIIKEYKELFETLEEYDKTREWPIGRERIDITLSRRTIRKLRELKNKSGKPISRIVEEAVLRV